MNDKLELLSAAELGAEVNAGRISPTDAVLYFERQIRERNDRLNAFVYTKFEYAESSAKQLEERLARGDIIGPFAGVPFAMKDFLPSKKGWTHSHGGVKSLIREDPEDSEFCRAMETAGGIALGKTNAPAFGFRGTTDNHLYGPTCNPFDLRYNSGGSSGGSAAAVAGGLISIAEGGDAGGSIRIPAAWCNLFGFKASAGLIPSIARPDAWSATHPYCTGGGLTKTVEDAAILLDLMARYDPRDPLSVARPESDFAEAMKRPVKGMRIAYTKDFGIFPVDPEVAAVVEAAVKRLEDAGAIVEPVEFHLPRTLAEYTEWWLRSICLDTAIELERDRRIGFDLVRDHRDELPEEFIFWNVDVAKGGMMDYYEFHKVRTEVLDAHLDVFDRYDLIVSPTTTCLPVLNASDGNTQGPTEVNGMPVEPLIGFAETFFENFTGNPAASVPAGLSAGGLPIGMQVIGKRYQDADVLAMAKTFEDIFPWRDRFEIAQNRL